MQPGLTTEKATTPKPAQPDSETQQTTDAEKNRDDRTSHASAPATTPALLTAQPQRSQVTRPQVITRVRPPARGRNGHAIWRPKHQETPAHEVATPMPRHPEPNRPTVDTREETEVENNHDGPTSHAPTSAETRPQTTTEQTGAGAKTA